MSLQLNTRPWYESSKKDPIPRAGWYEDFYNTQYQNRGGEFKSWIPDGCDLVPPTLTMGNGPNEAPESSANFFFWVQSRRQPEEELSTLAACAKFKCRTVDRPLVLTSDPKKEKKKQKSF
jgi:hypothetical protein